jgi:hypothetical protein
VNVLEVNEVWEELDPSNDNIWLAIITKFGKEHRAKHLVAV